LVVVELAIPRISQKPRDREVEASRILIFGSLLEVKYVCPYVFSVIGVWFDIIEAAVMLYEFEIGYPPSVFGKPDQLVARIPLRGRAMAMKGNG
jgi:hypothetical protein